MRNIEDAKQIAEMRDVLRRCNQLISQFADINSVNIPAILVRVKSVSKEFDIKQLVFDIKKYAE